MMTEPTEVRFKRRGIERSWRRGTLAGFVGSHAVKVNDKATGGLYVVLTAYVQQQTRGPRGGLKWAAMEARE